ncbi:Structural maintenance of chromosomes protein 3 [Puccinia graminis f. sp. tritici]|uniref:Structural maintenance of chromosomes protein n=2 Tax=Puccinia graminis f. sp. tritici TaxID=56615 RepID=E3L531_PUCGT|nr:uncharacterized protein PGTG_17512 [Puccinia graminis f. sp. tritici CRL 75-36-700-3]EFP91656.2 hypothetical protein PGTG_17512 [Puccinia graminis f. sp. tritici CRL 75-36-700-3]KAA1113569.1 Structural maintenance of chromosomes protein 3 [Puccinia graminis f. sp. tritici]
MHIESLTIQGFKSYRDATSVEHFSPGVNVVVGRNGSGKSNFFSAIRFLLNDQYGSLTREDRQSLLHEGSDNNSTFSAFVEAVFDNSDQRFPTGKSQVIIRRTIGSKKDEYSLDKKSTPKGEIMSLLESAGFSKSNPYYIVPQGRITHLTNIKDADRLNLLKEVAGTQVYEERRSESVKIMDDTSAKRVKIDELMESIETRLNELEEEKKELKEYDQLDRERRCLQYGIYMREMNEINDSLEHIESSRRKDLEEANGLRGQSVDRERQISNYESQLATARQKLESLAQDKLQLEHERRESIKARTQVECMLKDSEDLKEKDQSKRSKWEDEANRMKKEIDSKTKQLAIIRPQHEAQEKEYNQIAERLSELETSINSLYEKQGRSHQFRTQKERDQHIRAELKKLNELVRSREESLQQVISDQQRVKGSLAEIESRTSAVRTTIDDHKQWVHTKTTELSKIKAEHHQLTEKRKSLWKEDTRISQLLQNATNAKEKAVKDLRVTMDRNSSQGLDMVQLLMARGDVPGIYGPLYSLFEVDEAHKTAAEATAGNALFHVVVDNDGTAQRALEILAKEKKGRCTFVPLNRLKPKNVQYPSDNDAIPLIHKLHYDQKYQLAFEQVFAKTIVCRSLEVAGAYMRSHNLNGITSDGDKVDKKGSISGGYHETRRSRLESAKEIKVWSQKCDEESVRSREVKTLIRQLDQQITQLMGQIKHLEGEFERKQNERAPLAAELSSLQDNSEALKIRLQKFDRLRQGQEFDVKNLTTQINLLEAEMSSKMRSELSDDELERLNSATTEMDSLKLKMLDVNKRKVELTNQKNMIEIELKERLGRRLEEINKKIERIGDDSTLSQPSSNELELGQNELSTLTRSIDESNTQLTNISNEMEALTTSIQRNESKIEKLQAEQADDAREASKQSKNVERYWSKKLLLQQRRDECNNNIRSLGVLPEEAFEKYIRHRTEKLLRSLQKVTESLKKYSHVNKKAIEQYQNFTDERDTLIGRREELEKSAESITDLIEVLDRRKDEAIERTFKQVSKNFSEVFEKLVPLGRGRLIMQKRLNDEQRDEDSSEDDGDQQAGLISQYTGVSIKVSFNSKSDEGLRIQQLSGGQKSLVALATIFAIQKCDPAPFYLFDEIDANLDPDRRTSVAAMIGELGKEAQMICTTFRPEMLEHADQFWGVIFNQRKISTIKQIEKTHAKQFVESNERAPPTVT